VLKLLIVGLALSISVGCTKRDDASAKPSQVVPTLDKKAENTTSSNNSETAPPAKEQNPETTELQQTQNSTSVPVAPIDVVQLKNPLTQANYYGCFASSAFGLFNNSDDSFSLIKAEKDLAATIFYSSTGEVSKSMKSTFIQRKDDRGFESISQVIKDSQGRYIVSAFNDGSNGVGAVFYRILPNGELDKSFNKVGYIIFNELALTLPHSYGNALQYSNFNLSHISADAQNRIVIQLSAHWWSSGVNKKFTLGIMRLNENGAIDRTFAGPSGWKPLVDKDKRQIIFGDFSYLIESVGDNDNFFYFYGDLIEERVVKACHFGLDGKVTNCTQLSGLIGVQTLSDNSMVFAEYKSKKLTLSRWSKTGGAISSFGSNGQIEIPIDLGADGDFDRITLAGMAAANGMLVVATISPDGSFHAKTFDENTGAPTNQPLYSLTMPAGRPYSNEGAWETKNAFFKKMRIIPTSDGHWRVVAQSHGICNPTYTFKF
jgi:hypothetical protein